MRAVLAVLAGVIIGGVVNMGLITLGGNLFPPPDGVDPTDLESIKANIHLYEPRHFVAPLVAHGAGTLFGAAIAALIAASHKMRFALGIGVVFLLGGVAACMMIDAPTWFVVTDLAVCYIPMAWIGGKMFAKKPS